MAMASWACKVTLIFVGNLLTLHVGCGSLMVRPATYVTTVGRRTTKGGRKKREGGEWRTDATRRGRMDGRTDEQRIL